MAGTPNKVALIVALWCAGLLAGGQFAKVSVILPELRVLYPEQAGEVAWLLTLVSVVGAFLGGLAASLANRLGLQNVLVASLIVAGGLSLWQSTYPPFALMALLRVVEGMTHLGIVVTAPALMAETSSERWRGATMALWGTFFGVSFAIFGWFGIPLAHELGVNGLFQLHGIGLLLIAMTVFFLLRAVRASDPQNAASKPKPIHPFAALKDPRIIWSAIGWLFYTLTFLALLTILPSQLSEGLRPQATTAMSLVAIITGLLLLPVALMAFKATTMVLVGFLLAGFVTAFGGGSNLLTVAIALFAILGIVQSGTFAAVAELNQSTNARTFGYGLMAQTGNLGNLVGTPLLLHVLQKSGLGTLIITASAIYGLGFLALLYATGRVRHLEKSMNSDAAYGNPD